MAQKLNSIYFFIIDFSFEEIIYSGTDQSFICLKPRENLKRDVLRAIGQIVIGNQIRFDIFSNIFKMLKII